MIGRVAALSFALLGCAAEATVPDALDPTAFVEARRRLSALTADVGGERTEKVSLTIDAPYLPAGISARGAVAVRAPDSLRMILLGPGGTTAMDLWSKGDRFRFSIPAVERTIVGDARTPLEQKRGLPVDFLRWWMLRPLGGRLLAARRQGADLEVLLDDAGRVTTALLKPDGRIVAHRRWWSEGRGVVDEEWLEASGLGCGTVRYRQKSTGISVVAVCESRRAGASARAFEEPKEGGK
jgi:hypothetical protein